jgi:hypothetical protein
MPSGQRTGLKQNFPQLGKFPYFAEIYNFKIVCKTLEVTKVPLEPFGLFKPDVICNSKNIFLQRKIVIGFLIGEI